MLAFLSRGQCRDTAGGGNSVSSSRSVSSVGMRTPGDALPQTHTQNKQSLDNLTALAYTGVHFPVALSTQTLHASGLPLTLVLSLSVQPHEPGHQLWLICVKEGCFLLA